MHVARKFRNIQKLTFLAAAACLILLINMPVTEDDRFPLRLSFLVGAVLLLLYHWQQRLARRIFFAPLEELHGKFREVACDPLRLGATVAVSSGFEFRGLAEDFNRLSERLFLQQKELESQVEQRNAELRIVRQQLQRQFGDLRQSEERLRIIIRNSPVILFAFDSQGYFTMVEGQRGFIPAGLGKNRLPGASVYDLFGDLPMVTATGSDMTISRAIDRVLAGETISGTFQIEQTHFDLYCHPVIDGEGMVREVMGICFDVTDRIGMETRYRELSEEFQGLLDGIPDSLILLSPDTRVIWSNAGSSRLVGMAQDLLSGRLCCELWCGDACDERICPVRRSLTTGQSESAKMRTPNGRVWGVKTFPLKGNEGSIRGIIRWSSDITDRIRIEEDAMRSSHLAALGELAAGVAHEINNPNGLILLNISLLLESYQDAMPILEEHFHSQGDFPLGGIPFSRMQQEIPHLFSEMADGARRIRRIVDDLKNFVRQDPNEYTEKVDLNQAVETAARLSASTVKKSTGRFSMRLEKDLPYLLGNRQRLEQMIVNLLLNACQALADPGEEIVLQTRLDSASHLLILDVIDEGVGIDPEALAHITDPFFTTRRESGGTGLGLSVSARIIKEHGGSLHFDSQPGRGTRVTVTLPGILEDPIE